MSLTPVPPPRCTGCPHRPHAHACPECPCGVATLPHADHHTTGDKLDRIEALLERLSARIELALTELLAQHEACRRVPGLEARIDALEARLAAGSNGGGT